MAEISRHRLHRKGTRRQSSDSDRGVSLIEILVAITLMGVAGVAVLGAMATSARGSSVSRSQASAIVWLQSSGDYLTSHIPYLDCTIGTEPAVKAAYQAGLQASGAPRSPMAWPQTQMRVERIEFWDNATQAFASSCKASQIQQITIAASNPSDTYTSRLSVVRSK